MVPDLPTFAVDDGFAYEVPDALDVPIGSIVRIPLGGRRVRGWVVADREPERPRLRALLGVSGDHPVFDRNLLTTLRWAALHYVAPLAAVLSKAAPPNLPKGTPGDPVSVVTDPLDDPLPEVGAAIRAGKHTRTHVWMGPGPWPGPVGDLCAPALAAGKSALVIAPTVVEASEMAAVLGERFGDRAALTGSGQDAKERTRSWLAAATSPGRVLVGTREAAFRPVAGLSVAVVVGEGRRGMKDKATPTTHAREVLWRRSSVERFPLVLTDLMPTTDSIHRGPVILPMAGVRPWGLVEIVDRSEDPPGRGLLAERTRHALYALAGGSGRAFVFTHRRAAATRCVRCRALRRCQACGSVPGRTENCERCGAAVGGCVDCGGRKFEPLGADVGQVLAEIGGVIGRDLVGEPGSGRQVIVGSERDLPELGPIDLAIIIDADGVLRANHYRAGEEGLRVLARVVAAAGRDRGRRALVQTADPGHPAMTALRRADPVPFLKGEIESRAPLGLPPAGEILVLEASLPPDGAHVALIEAAAGRAEVHGPADHRGASRWLVQAPDLRPVRVALRGLVQEWRDAGAKVRVDVDPFEL
ncbi:hypothetical protein HQ535_15780 [bacterium]|nr:hypothetical protein [bacterium]